MRDCRRAAAYTGHVCIRRIEAGKRTLEQDLLESSAAIYHKRVCQLQREAKKQIDEHVFNCRAQSADPGGRDESGGAFARYEVDCSIRSGIERIHAEQDRLVDCERAMKAKRDANIRLHCRDRNA